MHIAFRRRAWCTPRCDQGLEWSRACCCSYAPPVDYVTAGFNAMPHNRTRWFVGVVTVLNGRWTENSYDGIYVKKWAFHQRYTYEIEITPRSYTVSIYSKVFYNGVHIPMCFSLQANCLCVWVNRGALPVETILLLILKPHAGDKSSPLVTEV